jgi:type-F conjugative transfer system pilin assembly protein TrbC
VDDIQEAEMLRLLIVWLITFGLWQAAYAQVADNPHADKAGRKAQQAVKSHNPHSDKAKALADQAAQSVKPGVSKEQERLNSDMGLSPAEKQEAASKPGGRLSPSERVYIFVSSSMPMEALRRYASDLDRLADPNIVMVLRGFVGGMKRFKPTGDFIGQVLRKDEACEPGKQQCEAYQAGIQIDPMLFRKYGIKQVPAVVYVPQVQVADSDDKAGSQTDGRDYSVVYGDASLGYVLGMVGRECGWSLVDEVAEMLK